ncbi:MAG TPA: hypothetical protein VK561_06125, partial [Bradyrhizobium sp.]|nr:hypothetical protein [Bradyrhizobium sp.]
ALLLFLGAAEQEIEQSFGGRAARRNGNQAYERGGGDKHHAAPHGLIRKLWTQRLLHPMQPNPLW